MNKFDLKTHPSDFGIPAEYWQAAADYAGMVILQGDPASVSEPAVERLARFLADEAAAGSCFAVPAERWRGHVADAREMLRAAAGLEHRGQGVASPMYAPMVTCGVEEEGR